MSVTKLGGRIGARIDGVRLGPDLGEATVAAIRAALLEHKVVFFRGQQHLDDEGHIAFAEQMGPLTTAHPTVNTGSAKVLSLAANKGMAANSWHTDVTFVDRIPAISILRGVTIPAYGGSTNWANTVAGLRLAAGAAEGARRHAVGGALQRLRLRRDVGERRAGPGRPQQRVQPRAVRLDRVRDRAPGRAGPPGDRRARAGARPLREEVRRPELRGVRALFNLLQARVTKLENTIRWTWEQGDVAMWDNRATQHYAVADFDEQRREVRRITVAGDVPVSIDGRRSVVRQGDADGFSNLDALIS